MTTQPNVRALRQYLLGTAGEEETAAIEREYFDRGETLQLVSDTEDDLIADYLDRRLTPDERDRFEQHYLASARHRTRVAVVRALRRTALRARAGDLGLARFWARVAPSLRIPPVAGQLAAAVALVALGIAAWTFNTPPAAPPAPGGIAIQPPPSEPAQPQQTETALPRRSVVVALTVAPINVRAGGEPATLVIPADADVVALELEGDGSAAAVERGRAIVRTVSGRQVWTGATTDGGTPRPGVVARLEIPAASFSNDDYVVELFAADANGRETERNRYFFRVR